MASGALDGVSFELEHLCGFDATFFKWLSGMNPEFLGQL
jgi:hypothetical protein